MKRNKNDTIYFLNALSWSDCELFIGEMFVFVIFHQKVELVTSLT